ncbi:hypothetical protein Esi_0062_0123 [Ectocarpus siliculosus]|uniref:F-box domain-containing protein n=1 Tax=Ectocarpus siliculosus TaxID=2880 RepID=D8LR75_ECTSI|nr:hypothetical protein Esi_0062_0123 [Ectocarpus siliculosus]|eukprot:CBN77748.1 hypothetical protein Esi_0062_0123 [Ectocarpus siliculosus]
MDGAMQDDDLWRRAFSTNAGLFFDEQADFGPLLTGDDTAAALIAAAGVADPVVGMPSPSPAPASSNVASIAPMPFVAAAPTPARQQQQQHQPHVRVQIACRPSTLVAAPPPPAPLASEEPPSATARPAPPPSQRQQRKIGPAPESARSKANLPAALSSSNAAESTGAALEQQAAAEGPPAEQQQQGAPNQRGGESFSRKRDRAKLLRQQMNDGLDNLHEALVEISTSGANLSASAATSLIPTRGPRRAAVVACSAGLVRDLISTCIALRKDKASLSARFAEALRQLQQQQQGASGGSSAHVESGAAGAAGDGETAARKRHDDGGSHGLDSGGAGGGAEAVVGVASSAKVFGQLLSLSVFGFLGPQSLEEASKVSREWRDKCTWDCNWSTLCVSRWRLGPEQRHAEVWRVPDDADGKGKGKGVARSAVSPPAPPPTWQSIYGRLHGDVHAPSGTFCPSHMVIGRSVQEGVAVWIALTRRSNGMTGRSVMTQGSTGLRTTEVIELRAVVQRVEEGPAVRVHPHAFKVRRVSGLRALLNDHSGGGGGGSRSSGAAIVTTTTGFFPPVSQGEDRFSPKFTINRGAAESSSSSSSAAGLLMNGGGGGRGAGAGVRSSWSGTAAATASPAAEATPPLALYEYAAVDFFIEAAGCPTEADFLRLEACVDVAVSGATASAAGATPVVGSVCVPLLSVGLTERNRPRPAAAAAAAAGLRAMGVGIGQPMKRWF